MNGPPNQYHGPPMGPGDFPPQFPPNMPPGQGFDDMMSPMGGPPPPMPPQDFGPMGGPQPSNIPSGPGGQFEMFDDPSFGGQDFYHMQ